MNGEVDESYFGPHRVRGKRERSASGKTIQAIIRGRMSADAIIHSAG
jgi:hypothetical protein